jgi:hypothetical protein
MQERDTPYLSASRKRKGRFRLKTSIHQTDYILNGNLTIQINSVAIDNRSVDRNTTSWITTMAINVDT